MSNATISPAAATIDPSHNGHAHHDPHLAHHFDTPEQQYSSAKLGMWIFLGTEILMFGGLFCAYAVYRHNHPDVFEFAHHYLDKWLGAINTLVLITSSLTMAWAVRSSQLGNQTSLRWLLAVTIVGGYVFLGIKSVEYNKKWHHILFIGTHNHYRHGYQGPPPAAEAGETKIVETVPAASAAPAAVKLKDDFSLIPPDPNWNNTDQAKIRANFPTRLGLAPDVIKKETELNEAALKSSGEITRVYTFFAVYFFMTGLHGLHVIIGMSLIAWVLLRALGPKNRAWAIPLIPASIGVFLAVIGIIIWTRETPAAGDFLVITGLILAVLSIIWALIWVPMRRNQNGESEFGPTYFTPVDLVGLYWHLVDMVWIFLFPLLYLIH